MIATNSSLTAQEFDALFDDFTSTVFRLEALPRYAIGGAEAERIAAFEHGLPRPLRSVRTDPWLARIATSTITAGKSWSRLRVVDDPMTDYQRYQLESQREAQAVGEEVLLVRRADVGFDPGPDFWLFDERDPLRAHAVLMHYDADGRIERRELIDGDMCESRQLWRVKKLALRHAVPLNSFLAVSHG